MASREFPADAGQSFAGEFVKIREAVGHGKRQHRNERTTDAGIVGRFAGDNAFHSALAEGHFRILHQALRFIIGNERRHGELVGTEVVVSAKDVPQPVRLRYLHSAPWFGALYNEVNLPVGAFHVGK